MRRQASCCSWEIRQGDCIERMAENRRLMVKVGERKCIHKAANGRKAAIYRITSKGRATLVGTGGGGASAAVENADVSVGSPRSGEPAPPSEEASGDSRSPAPDASPEALELPIADESSGGYRDLDQRAA